MQHFKNLTTGSLNISGIPQNVWLFACFVQVEVQKVIGGQSNKKNEQRNNETTKEFSLPDCKLSSEMQYAIDEVMTVISQERSPWYTK